MFMILLTLQWICLVRARQWRIMPLVLCVVVIRMLVSASEWRAMHLIWMMVVRSRCIRM